MLTLITRSVCEFNARIQRTVYAQAVAFCVATKGDLTPFYFTTTNDLKKISLRTKPISTFSDGGQKNWVQIFIAHKLHSFHNALSIHSTKQEVYQHQLFHCKCSTVSIVFNRFRHSCCLFASLQPKIFRHQNSHPIVCRHPSHFANSTQLLSAVNPFANDFLFDQCYKLLSAMSMKLIWQSEKW